MRITAMRTFRYVYRDPKLRYNEFNFLNREGEPLNVVMESPKWFYSVVSGGADPVLRDCDTLCLSDFNYWLSIVAARHVTSPVYPNDLWSIMLWMYSEFNMDDVDTDKAPVVWYDPLKCQIRVGSNYKTAIRKSIDDFIDIGETRAVSWLNQGFKLSHASNVCGICDEEVRSFYGH